MVGFPPPAKLPVAVGNRNTDLPCASGRRGCVANDRILDPARRVASMAPLVPASTHLLNSPHPRLSCAGRDEPAAGDWLAGSRVADSDRAWFVLSFEPGRLGHAYASIFPC